MTDYDKLVAALRCKRDDCEGCDLAFFDKDEGWMCQYAAKDDDAAAAIEALQANVKDLNEALKVESKARENAESKRYCYNCAHMDASMYDEAWYGICKLNDFEVEAIHGWGCTDWAKMEVQDGKRCD